jgi:ubiquinone/menaquinone biosynthesis C-methylase UbiE
MYQGQNVTPYQVLAAALKPYLKPNDSLLEIGCSSGYYSEVLSYLLSTPIRYTGADYSEAFIDMAKQYYPESEFYVADGAKLPFEDNAFRFAISGCVLLHTPNYVDHIRETVRVSGEYIIAHRTPVCKKRDTFLQKKNAYGVETVELTFNEIEFIKQFSNHGAELKGLIEFSADPAKDEYQVTYLFRKI